MFLGLFICPLLTPMTHFLARTAILLGAVEALLLARIVLRLLAARPDNPVFALLFALTGPLVAPFAGLDTEQPRFGSVLELSTLALSLLLAAGILVLALSARNLRRGGRVKTV